VSSSPCLGTICLYLGDGNRRVSVHADTPNQRRGEHLGPELDLGRLIEESELYSGIVRAVADKRLRRHQPIRLTVFLLHDVDGPPKWVGDVRPLPFRDYFLNTSKERRLNGKIRVCRIYASPRKNRYRGAGRALELFPFS
jgi:hypothetical protein